MVQTLKNHTPHTEAVCCKEESAFETMWKLTPPETKPLRAAREAMQLVCLKLLKDHNS